MKEPWLAQAKLHPNKFAALGIVSQCPIIFRGVVLIPATNICDMAQHHGIPSTGVSLIVLRDVLLPQANGFKLTEGRFRLDIREKLLYCGGGEG